MNRREFLVGGGALALSGCAGAVSSSRAVGGVRPSAPSVPQFHVFAKMFQPPVTKGPEEMCDLMAAAGYDGIQWTVRPKGIVEPEQAKAELPRLCRIAESRGLKNLTICTAITDASDPVAQTIVKTAADCGIQMFRSGYFFYDAKKETFAQSFDRIKRGFAALAELGGKTGVKAVYQNHSSWGPSVFGGVVWDDYECLRDLDPASIGLEYDPMHAFYETNLSWSHGFELVAPWIAAIDLKDFHYVLSPKNPKLMKKAMVGAGQGVVPWKEVRELVERNGVPPFYVLHFEHAFDKSDLKKTVSTELSHFKGVF